MSHSFYCSLLGIVSFFSLFFFSYPEFFLLKYHLETEPPVRRNPPALEYISESGGLGKHMTDDLLFLIFKILLFSQSFPLQEVEGAKDREQGTCQRIRPLLLALLFFQHSFPIQQGRDDKARLRICLICQRKKIALMKNYKNALHISFAEFSLFCVLISHYCLPLRMKNFYTSFQSHHSSHCYGNNSQSTNLKYIHRRVYI